MRILREKDVRERTGLSRTTRWRMERAGTFPARVRLSENAVGWIEADIERFLSTRPRGLAWVGPKVRL